MLLLSYNITVLILVVYVLTRQISTFFSHAVFDSYGAVRRQYKCEHDNHRDLYCVGDDHSELRRCTSSGKHWGFLTGGTTARNGYQMCDGAGDPDNRWPADRTTRPAKRGFHTAAIKHGAAASEATASQRLASKDV